MESNENQFVWPDFKHSVVNLAATIEQFLGKMPKHPVLPKLAEKLKSNYKNVVYIVIDAMGSKILEKNLPADSFFRKHQIDTVTSVFPSTTTAATTSLITAMTPAEHGWFAWTVDFDGEVIALFRNRNYYTKELTADPDFAHHKLPYQKFFDDVHNDRAIYTCLPDNISKIHSPHEIEFHTLGQMFRRLKQVCRQPDKKFVYSYFSDLDHFMHTYGTTARRSRNLLRKIEHKIARLAKRNSDTLFVITADHGQVDVNGFVYFCDDTELQSCLAHPISLDPRGACFKLKPGKDRVFRAAFQKYEPDFALFPSQELIQKGVFGDFKLHPEYQKYLGDYIAIGKNTAKMAVFVKRDQYRKGHKLYRGIHTGLTVDEMMVPVIVVEGGKLNSARR